MPELMPLERAEKAIPLGPERGRSITWDVPHREDDRHIQRYCDVTDTTPSRIPAKLERSSPIRSGQCRRNLVGIMRPKRLHLRGQRLHRRTVHYITLILPRLTHTPRRWHERDQRRTGNIRWLLGVRRPSEAYQQQK